jgi:hypothetical protein
MKKLLIVCIIGLLLTGCAADEKPVKLNENAINGLPYGTREYIKSENPDVVTMKYLIKNAEDYIGGFVIVAGKVDRVDVTDYSKEDLSIMSDRAIEVLKDVISYDVYLDGADRPLTDNTDNPNVDTGKEYYFYVSVNKIIDHTFNIIDVFN